MQNANDSDYIGKEAEKKAAFTHAGVEEASVYDIEVDFDYEYGKMIYEVEFKSSKFEYDYSVEAKTGEILYSHRDYHDDYVEEDKTVNSNVESQNTPVAEDIGKAAATAIALNHAGFTENQVTRLKTERGIDDGRIEYSVEFTADDKEYDYEINGSNGSILDYDMEKRDFDLVMR